MAVYRLARQHSRGVRALIETADTRGFADLVSQIRSSAASIPANILEGQLRRFRSRPPEAIHELRDLQNQITALLITTIRNLESELRDEA